MTPTTVTLTTAPQPAAGPLTLRLLPQYETRGCTIWADEADAVSIVAPGGWGVMATHAGLTSFDLGDPDCFGPLIATAEAMFSATVRACMTPAVLAAHAPQAVRVVTGYTF